MPNPRRDAKIKLLPEKCVSGQYTPMELRDAVADVVIRQDTVPEASLAYNVPRSTIKNHVNKYRESKIRSLTDLTNLLQPYLLHMKRLSIKPSVAYIRECGSLLRKQHVDPLFTHPNACGSPLYVAPVNDAWANQQLDTYSKLVANKTARCDTTCKQALLEITSTRRLKKLSSNVYVLGEAHIPAETFKDPSEEGVSFAVCVEAEGEVLPCCISCATKSTQHFIISYWNFCLMSLQDPNKESVSIAVCVGAEGEVLPCCISCATKSTQHSIRDTLPAGWIVRHVSGKNGQDTRFFANWLEKIFLPWKSRAKPAVLLVDIQTQQIDPMLLKTMVDHDIFVVPFSAGEKVKNPVNVSILSELLKEFSSNCGDENSISFKDIPILWNKCIKEKCTAPAIEKVMNQSGLLDMRTMPIGQGIDVTGSGDQSQIRSQAVASLTQGGVVEDSATESDTESEILPFFGKLTRQASKELQTEGLEGLNLNLSVSSDEEPNSSDDSHAYTFHMGGFKSHETKRKSSLNAMMNSIESPQRAAPPSNITFQFNSSSKTNHNKGVKEKESNQNNVEAISQEEHLTLSVSRDNSLSISDGQGRITTDTVSQSNPVNTANDALLDDVMILSRSDDMHECSECGKTYSSNRALTMHLRIEHKFKIIPQNMSPDNPSPANVKEVDNSPKSDISRMEAACVDKRRNSCTKDKSEIPAKSSKQKSNTRTIVRNTGKSIVKLKGKRGAKQNTKKQQLTKSSDVMENADCGLVLQCPVCSARYNGGSSLSHHLRKTHKTNIAPFIFKCPILNCGSKTEFVSLAGVVYHLNHRHSLTKDDIENNSINVSINPVFAKRIQKIKNNENKAKNTETKSVKEIMNVSIVTNSARACSEPRNIPSISERKILSHTKNDLMSRRLQRYSLDSVQDIVKNRERTSTENLADSKRAKETPERSRKKTAKKDVKRLSLRKTIKPTKHSVLSPGRRLTDEFKPNFQTLPENKAKSSTPSGNKVVLTNPSPIKLSTLQHKGRTLIAHGSGSGKKKQFSSTGTNLKYISVINVAKRKLFAPNVCKKSRAVVSSKHNTRSKDKLFPNDNSKTPSLQHDLHSKETESNLDQIDVASNCERKLNESETSPMTKRVLRDHIKPTYRGSMSAERRVKLHVLGKTINGNASANSLLTSPSTSLETRSTSLKKTSIIHKAKPRDALHLATSFSTNSTRMNVLVRTKENMRKVSKKKISKAKTVLASVIQERKYIETQPYTHKTSRGHNTVIKKASPNSRSRNLVSCSVCKKEFRHKSILSAHMQIRHTKTGQNDHKLMPLLHDKQEQGGKRINSKGVLVKTKLRGNKIRSKDERSCEKSKRGKVPLRFKGRFAKSSLITEKTGRDKKLKRSESEFEFTSDETFEDFTCQPIPSAGITGSATKNSRSKSKSPLSASKNNNSLRKSKSSHLHRSKVEANNCKKGKKCVSSADRSAKLKSQKKQIDKTSQDVKQESQSERNRFDAAKSTPVQVDINSEKDYPQNSSSASPRVGANRRRRAPRKWDPDMIDYRLFRLGPDSNTKKPSPNKRQRSAPSASASPNTEDFDADIFEDISVQCIPNLLSAHERLKTNDVLGSMGIEKVILIEGSSSLQACTPMLPKLETTSLSFDQTGNELNMDISHRVRSRHLVTGKKENIGLLSRRHFDKSAGIRFETDPQGYESKKLTKKVLSLFVPIYSVHYSNQYEFNMKRYKQFLATSTNKLLEIDFSVLFPRKRTQSLLLFEELLLDQETGVNETATETVMFTEYEEETVELPVLGKSPQHNDSPAMPQTPENTVVLEKTSYWSTPLVIREEAQDNQNDQTPKSAKKLDPSVSKIKRSLFSLAKKPALKKSSTFQRKRYRPKRCLHPTSLDIDGKMMCFDCAAPLPVKRSVPAKKRVLRLFMGGSFKCKCGEKFDSALKYRRHFRKHKNATPMKEKSNSDTNEDSPLKDRESYEMDTDPAQSCSVNKKEAAASAQSRESTPLIVDDDHSEVEVTDINEQNSTRAPSGNGLQLKIATNVVEGYVKAMDISGERTDSQLSQENRKNDKTKLTDEFINAEAINGNQNEDTTAVPKENITNSSVTELSENKVLVDLTVDDADNAFATPSNPVKCLTESESVDTVLAGAKVKQPKKISKYDKVTCESENIGSVVQAMEIRDIKSSLNAGSVDGDTKLETNFQAVDPSFASGISENKPDIVDLTPKLEDADVMIVEPSPQSDVRDVSKKRDLDDVTEPVTKKRRRTSQTPTPAAVTSMSRPKRNAPKKSDPNFDYAVGYNKKINKRESTPAPTPKQTEAKQGSNTLTSEITGDNLNLRRSQRSPRNSPEHLNIIGTVIGTVKQTRIVDVNTNHKNENGDKRASVSKKTKNDTVSSIDTKRSKKAKSNNVEPGMEIKKGRDSTRRSTTPVRSASSPKKMPPKAQKTTPRVAKTSPPKSPIKIKTPVKSNAAEKKKKMRDRSKSPRKSPLKSPKMKTKSPVKTSKKKTSPKKKLKLSVSVKRLKDSPSIKRITDKYAKARSKSTKISPKKAALNTPQSSARKNRLKLNKSPRTPLKNVKQSGSPKKSGKSPAKRSLQDEEPESVIDKENDIKKMKISQSVINTDVDSRQIRSEKEARLRAKLAKKIAEKNRMKVMGGRKCNHIDCRERSDRLTCCLQVSVRCERIDSNWCDKSVTSSWQHVTCEEHVCLRCWTFFSCRENLGAVQYARWTSAWAEQALRSEPSVKLHIVDQHLAHWVQCNKCSKWRRMTQQYRMTSSLNENFVCNVKGPNGVEPCQVPESPAVVIAKEPEFLTSLPYPPFLKNHPAAPFLLNYAPDEVGMSIVDNSLAAMRARNARNTQERNYKGITVQDLNIAKSNKESFLGDKLIDTKLSKLSKVDMLYTPQVSDCEEFLQPFLQPGHQIQAMALDPCHMCAEEVQTFPQFQEAQNAYLTVRNLVLALWCHFPKDVLTARTCVKYLICRGLVRIACAKLVEDILHFLTVRAYVNVGLLSHLPTKGILPKAYNKASVIIIGGGIAGVAAARQLHNFGTKVTVLEAAPQIGGRLRDGRYGNVCVGEGAQTLYGNVNNPISLICHQKEIPTRRLSSNCRLLTANGSDVDDELDARVDSHFNAMIESVVEWRGSRDVVKDVSLLDKIDQLHEHFKAESLMPFGKEEEGLVQFHISNLEYACGCSLDKPSAFSWDQNEDYPQYLGEHLLLQDGFQSLLKQMARSLDVRLNAKATIIRYDKEKVKVTFQSSGKGLKTLEADKVIIALPVSVLQSKQVKFDPSLPDVKVKAINEIGIGTMEKVILEFAENFWSERLEGADFFGCVPKEKEDRGLFNIFYSVPPKTLVTHLYGSGLELVKELEEEAIVNMCCQKLRHIFKLGSQPLAKAYKVTRWCDDDRTGMAYSYLPVGTNGDIYDRLAENVQEKIYFAGEATNRQHPQSVTGAFESGLRAAKCIALSSFNSGF